jgi:SAM-dependent methyltransferase
MPSANFDRIARPYRWFEYFSFGPMLERCRLYRIPQLISARRALVLGDGDGRFLARLLTRNPHLHADVVDQSPAMLRLLASRVAAVRALDRIQVHQSDALTFNPHPIGDRTESRGLRPKHVCTDGQPYDAVITHFFLDCFTTDEVLALAAKIHPHLAPNARWIVSEFAIPPGLAALPAKSIVQSLYFAFRLLTGLRTHTLPDYASALTCAGLTLEDRKTFLSGLLVSDSWSVTPGKETKDDSKNPNI